LPFLVTHTKALNHVQHHLILRGMERSQIKPFNLNSEKM